MSGCTLMGTYKANISINMSKDSVDFKNIYILFRWRKTKNGDGENILSQATIRKLFFFKFGCGKFINILKIIFITNSWLE